MFKSRSYLFIILTFFAVTGFAERLKDIASIAGVRENQLVGYGLVVGLTGTGDATNKAPFTSQSFSNMMRRLNIRIPENARLDLRNVAAVAVSAKLPPFVKSGQTIDITVSSIGNASSLRGGTLLMTPLRGADGKIYAVGQGSVVVSGINARGRDGSRITVNIPSNGRIPNGATVEQSIPMPYEKTGYVRFNLYRPDFTTAKRVVLAINKMAGTQIAFAEDAATIRVKMPVDTRVRPVQYGADSHHYTSKNGSASQRSGNGMVAMPAHQNSSANVMFLSKLENLQLKPGDAAAKVVVNSRTGTVVIGQYVRVMPAAVSHGNLAVTISESPFVSQPEPFSRGETVVGETSEVSIEQEKAKAFLMQPGASLRQIINTINRVGASPGDLVAILESLKAVGALRARLVVL